MPFFAHAFVAVLFGVLAIIVQTAFGSPINWGITIAAIVVGVVANDLFGPPTRLKK